MKKIICLFLSMLLLGLFTACEDPISYLPTNTGESETTTETTTEVTETSETTTETDENDGWTNIY